MIPVLLAIGLGLLASLIQSIGLTIQRKSHILNSALPIPQQRPSHKRPLWITGFVLFMLANVGGTIFQIGALPIVLLAPLGAVSLLYNALLARVLLDDLLSVPLVLGSGLIALGAGVVAYYGAIPSPAHTLPELMEFYTRPPFVALATLLAFVVGAILVGAHMTEYNLLHPLPRRRKRHHHLHGPHTRTNYSYDHLATLAEMNENPSGIATPILTVADEAARRGLPTNRLVAAAREQGLLPTNVRCTPHPSHPSNKRRDEPPSTPPGRGRQYRSALAALRRKMPPPPAPSSSSPAPSTRSPATNSEGAGYGTLAAQTEQPVDLEGGEGGEGGERGVARGLPVASTTRKTRLGLGVAYASVSGTLSGVCLLLAKTAVELLLVTLSPPSSAPDPFTPPHSSPPFLSMTLTTPSTLRTGFASVIDKELTTFGTNQFMYPQTYLLLTMLATIALAQLWYLNHALKWADPTLVCPLAFCTYNCTSIMLGLVYYDQVGVLSGTEARMVVSGTVVLLLGVWSVSLHQPRSSLISSEQPTLTLPTSSTPAPQAPQAAQATPGEASTAEDGGIQRTPPRTQRTRPNIPPIQTLSPFTGSRDPSMATEQPYTNFWDSGFSIALAPSSPGFGFPSSSRTRRVQEDRKNWFGNRSPMFEPGGMRRASSGGSVGQDQRSRPESVYDVEGEDGGAESSAWHYDPPELDPSTLRDALARNSDDRPWYARLWMWVSGSPSEDEQDDVEDDAENGQSAVSGHSRTRSTRVRGDEVGERSSLLRGARV